MNRDDAEEYTQSLGQVMSGGWRQVLLGERLGVPEALGLTTRQWVNDRLGGYVRISIDERREAALEMKNEGMTQREIGDVLGVDQATVSRAAHTRDADASPESTNDQVPESPPDANASPEPDPPPRPDPAELERQRDEKERRQAIARQVNRLRNLIDGWETVTHLHNNPLRSEVLDAIGDYDRALVLKIEEAISP